MPDIFIFIIILSQTNRCHKFCHTDFNKRIGRIKSKNSLNTTNWTFKGHSIFKVYVQYCSIGWKSSGTSNLFLRACSFIPRLLILYLSYSSGTFPFPLFVQPLNVCQHAEYGKKENTVTMTKLLFYLEFSRLDMFNFHLRWTST